MSRTNKTQLTKLSEESTKEESPRPFEELPQMEMETKQDESHTTRLILECNADAGDLSKGVVVHLSNAKQVFDNLNIKDADFNKGILTDIRVKSIYSDCSEPITMSLNLFNREDTAANVTNKEGWLHAPQQTDFGTAASNGDGTYRNLVNIMPFEKTRTDLQVYNPEDLASDRYIQQYGNCNAKNLKEGVIAFTDENYYLVRKNHIALPVIKNNWEQLGINLEDCHTFDDKYVQVPMHIFDRVVRDLESKVLARMPFTDLNNIKAKFSSKPSKEYAMEHEEGKQGKYKVCVEMQMAYQFPSGGKGVEEEKEEA
jgi:hypothetical protein